MLDEQVKELWQTQDAAPPAGGLERVRAAAERLDYCARRGKWTLWAVMAIELAVLGPSLPGSPLTVQIGSVLIVAGLTFAMWRYYRARLGLPEGIAGSGLEYYRGVLVRQRDALRGMWLWFLCPLMPGPALIFLWTARRKPLFGLGMLAFLAVMNVWIAWSLERRARKLDRVLERLDKDRP